MYYGLYILLVNCLGGTLAYASHCMLDISDNNRPIAGFINICPSVRYFDVSWHCISTTVVDSYSKWEVHINACTNVFEVSFIISINDLTQLIKRWLIVTGGFCCSIIVTS